LSKIILFGERSLRRALSAYVAHYDAERNHQRKSNVLLFPRITELVGVGLCNVASGWVGSCVITIEKPRELDKSRAVPMKLWPGTPVPRLMHCCLR
jgi:hypothetical protein